ncbi:SapC family protein [Alteraurantiacibacter aquimixticola]|uniref:Peptide ABC transporter permease n=1 Tax=Alteraurantiacibacter aquimixticola TaxID=2489173 RepID=A0A4T3F7L4_9SPHN|nr:SapC family protein [Alteraurantiacibacter aquimixticola]TIX50970.1 peptide ABC transporter permease [Alteraurantiacibacter aquimixticola]
MTSVLLNNVDHHDLRIITRGGSEFGDSVNQVMVFPTEFEQVQREFPIVLRKDGEGKLRPVALLGLDRDENLFLGPDGGWLCENVPALLQRGPFSIAAPGGGQGDPQIMIDPDHPRVSKSEGEPIFLEHGGNAPVLEKMLGVLRAIYVGNGLLDPMVEAFEAAGLLRPFNLQLRVGPDKAYAISDAVTIDRERLAALGGEDLAALNKSGFLQSAFLIAASLGNLQRLVDRKGARLAAAGDA